MINDTDEMVDKDLIYSILDKLEIEKYYLEEKDGRKTVIFKYNKEGIRIRYTKRYANDRICKAIENAKPSEAMKN